MDKAGIGKHSGDDDDCDAPGEGSNHTDSCWKSSPSAFVDGVTCANYWTWTSYINKTWAYCKNDDDDTIDHCYQDTTQHLCQKIKHSNVLPCKSTPKAVCHSPHQAVNADETCVYDPTCSPDGGLGCNASGVGLKCRFCGFTDSVTGVAYGDCALYEKKKGKGPKQAKSTGADAAAEVATADDCITDGTYTDRCNTIVSSSLSESDNCSNYWTWLNFTTRRGYFCYEHGGGGGKDECEADKSEEFSFCK